MLTGPEPRRPAAWCCVAALAGFVLLQSSALTATGALPALALFGALAGWRGELDFARGPTFAEYALLALLAAWCVGIAASGDAARGVALSVPPLAAALGAVLLARAPWTDATRAALALSVLAAAVAQAAQVLLAFAFGAGRGASAVTDADVPWLVVPNDLAWAGASLALLPTLVRTFPGRATQVAGALVVLVVAGAAICAQSRLALLVALLALVPAVGRRGLALWVAAAAVAVVAAMSWGKGLTSLDSRIELWRAALELGAAHPWTGIGPGGFDAAVEHVAPAHERIDPRAMPWPHSLPLEAFALLGVPGLLALGAVALAGYRRDRRPPAAGMMLAVAAIALVEASLLRVWCWWGITLLLHWPPPTPRKDDAR
jgi:O-antigen ligase